MTPKIDEMIFGDISKVDGDKLFVTESDLEIPHGEDYKIRRDKALSLAKEV